MRRTLLFFALLLFVTVSGARAQDKSDPPLITVTGQAEVKVAPDEVVFTLEVEKTDKDLAIAKNQNDESVRGVLGLARRFKVAAQDVKTDYISVEMKYTTDLVPDTDGESSAVRKVKREFVGYAVSKTIIIRFTDLGRFEDFFSEVLRAGVSRINSVEFRTSQLRKHRDEARALAIRAAKEKATALTKEIGQSIGKAYSIREEGYRSSAASNNFSTVTGGTFSADDDSTIAPGMITVTAQVTVSFILN
ncbi:MAG: uncharacterized protein QOJ64_4470 [Acidobacteriota bacterium]|jgi:uncharacterized protein YggE|nr:uncharacterized protein [Acidobacteriota bacterium]